MTRGTRRQFIATLAAGGLAAAVVSGLMLPLAAAAGAAPGIAPAAGVGAGYWHTSGNQILDSSGNPVRIAGINWYGFETPDEIAHGLWVQDYHTIINDIAKLGYNTIRIPFSNQMVETPIVPQNLGFNNNTRPHQHRPQGPERAAGPAEDRHLPPAQAGLKVILDDHRSEAGESAEQNGLWYTSTYTSQNWVNDWVDAGQDVRGQPDRDRVRPAQRAAHPGRGHLRPGRHLGHRRRRHRRPAGLRAGRQRDPRGGPERADLLRGHQREPDASRPAASTPPGGAATCQGVAQFPVTLSSAGHVVYSAHDYGPNLFQQTWFNSSTTPASLDAVWNNWGYIYTQDIAPVWVGEFGTDNTASDVSSPPPRARRASGSRAWCPTCTRNPWMGWTYWALNGEDSYDLLDSNYDPTPVSALKQSLLAGIQFPLPGAGNGTPPPLRPPPGVAFVRVLGRRTPGPAASRPR